MNKTALIVISLLSSVGASFASSPAVREQAITSVGTPTSVSISTSAWTKCPATTADTRVGVVVGLAATNNAGMAGIMVNTGVTAPATSLQLLPLSKGSYNIIPVSPGVELYLISLHTAAESAICGEIVSQ